MARVIKFPEYQPQKFGHKKARTKKKNLEDLGQLNMFTPVSEGKVVQMQPTSDPFEQALNLDESGDARAKMLYEQALSDDVHMADASCNLGIIESQEANFVRAIDHFTKCLQVEPRHFEGHYNLANVYSEVGNLKLAKLHYQVAIEIKPEFPNSYYNLGLVLAMNNELKPAIEILQQYQRLTTLEEGEKANQLIKSLRRSLANQA